MCFNCSSPLSNENCWYKDKLINIIISMKFWCWHVTNIKENREAAAFAYFIGNDNHPFVIYRHLADEKHTVSRYFLQQWSFLVCNLTTSLPPHRKCTMEQEKIQRRHLIDACAKINIKTYLFLLKFQNHLFCHFSSSKELTHLYNGKLY